MPRPKPVTEQASEPEQPEDAPSASPVAPPASILLKLVAVLNEVNNVKKSGWNDAQKYRFARESDVLDKVRPILAREHLLLFPSIIGHELREQGKTRSGSTNWLSVVHVQFTWVNADNGFVWPDPQIWVGYGQDTGDKGVYKAVTGAMKYYLFKTFLISTGDDPEADTQTDRRAAAADAEEGPTVTRREATPGVQRGGRSSRPTEPQIRELWNLFRAAHMGPTEVVAFIGEHTKVATDNVDASKQAGLLNLVRSLSATEVGMLIRTLSESAGGSEGTDGTPEGGDDDGAVPRAEEPAGELGPQPVV